MVWTTVTTLWTATEGPTELSHRPRQVS